MEQANLLQAMKERHSVRSYLEKPIDPQSVQLLRAFIDNCNRESGLHMQLVLNKPNAFSGLMAHYGKFSGVQNYIAVVGKKGSELEEKSGYFGEKVVLYAQSLGLNTCWVAMTYSKVPSAFSAGEGEKLCAVIAVGYGKTQGSGHRVKSLREVTEGEPPFGYGQTQGVPHQSKPRESVMKAVSNPPAWFLQGIDAALLAPTAMNQQKFTFSLQGNTVSAKAGIGFYSKIDHFEVGAGKENFRWA